MNRQTKAVSVGCILLAIFLCGSALLPHIVQAANTVTATITIPHYGFDLAITPDGKYVYVPDLNGVAVISTATNTVTANVNLNGAENVAITPNGKYAYVIVYDTQPNEQKNYVAVISTATNKVTKSITLEGNPTGVAIAPSGEYAYVAMGDLTNGNIGLVSVISTATNTITTTVTVKGSSQGIAITPNGQYVYVVGTGGMATLGGTESNNTVSVINTADNTLATTISVGIGGLGEGKCMAVTPDGAYVYVLNGGNNSLSVISTATNIVTTTITGLNSALCIAITPNGDDAYVTGQNSDNSAGVAWEISTATNAATATIPLATYPYGVAITPDGEFAYIANGVNCTVSVLSIGNDVAPTASSSPAASKIPTQPLIIILLAIIILALAAVIIAKRKTWKPDPTKISTENSTPET